METVRWALFLAVLCGLICCAGDIGSAYLQSLMQERIFIVGGPEFVELRSITIYDRWGSQIYNGSRWDGKSNGQLVFPGVYVYSLIVIMEDGLERTLFGEVTLVR